MQLGRSLVVVVLLLSLAGCANAIRDTWTSGDLNRLQTDHRNCLQTTNRDTSDIPAPAGMLHRARYKDCMERFGYTKLQTEKISLKSEDACGQSNQTCFRALTD